MKKKTIKLLPLLGTLVASTVIFGANEVKNYEQGMPVEEGQLGKGYSAPARIDVQGSWDAYIDGQPATYFRCNYVLRGMKVPAGKHTIEYRFEPKAVAKGETITLISSVLLYGGALAALIGMWLKNRKQIKA